VALALGVLSFIRRNFPDAARYFEDGIRENPTDHTLWNKYGAAMANSQNIPAALKIYQQALEIRPNYVRTMANIGLAHRSQGRYQESLPYFLNALILNP
jgi:peroxin-5